MSRYCLPLKDPAAPPPAVFLAGQRPDGEAARIFLRENPGFLGRGLELERARALAERAAAAGLETLLVPEESLPRVPAAEAAEKVDPGPDGLHFRTQASAEYVRYDQVTALAAAAYLALPDPRSRADLRAPLLLKLAELAGLPRPDAPAPRPETRLRADLLWGAPARRLLLRPEALDYSSLPSRSPASEANFRALLGLLAAAALRAVRNHALAVIIAGGPLAPLRLASSSAADLDLSRLLLLTGAQ